jgi:hypothetical protein
VRAVEPPNLFPVSKMKARLVALSLLDRALAAVPDVELAAVVAVLPDDHREAMVKVAGDSTVGAIREAARLGRVNGVLEQIGLVLSDKCLADCVEALGDNAENPTEPQLAEVLPGIVETHGLGMTRVMMASAVTGEAPASVALVRLLKTHELVKLPPAEAHSITTVVKADDNSPEREALREARKARKKAEQSEAAARRAQVSARR